ncbi:unnamed protein product [Lymnaea stagnalis]|uniref:HCLS1-associated protein X-1 n=1 Tax=Lymnaea stagnalis TaxID=6523 RepID=A0AAV2H9M4_LYMST
MDMGEIFRRLFGLRNPSFYSRSPLHNFDEEDDDEQDINDHQEDAGISIFFGDQSRGVEDMFEHFHGDMSRQMDALHRQMEDMMRGFGNIDFSSVFQTPKMKLPLDPITKTKQDDTGNIVIWSGTQSPFFSDGQDQVKKSPRDFMLKEGTDIDDIQPRRPVTSLPPRDKQPKVSEIITVPPPTRFDLSERLDTDLDGKVSEKNILDLIKNPTDIQALEPVEPQLSIKNQPQIFSSSRSFSFSTIRGPDGKVEQRKVVRDSSGQEESTITRSLGDKSYSVTTVTKADGQQETREAFNNIDEKEIGVFKETWSKPDNNVRLTTPDVSLQDRDLFSKLFNWKIR